MKRLIRWICLTFFEPDPVIYADWVIRENEFATFTPLHPIARARQEVE